MYINKARPPMTGPNAAIEDRADTAYRHIRNAHEAHPGKFDAEHAHAKNIMDTSHLFEEGHVHTMEKNARSVRQRAAKLSKVNKAGETARKEKMNYSERQTLSTDSRRPLAGLPQRGIKKEHESSVKKLGLHQTRKKDQSNIQADVNFNVGKYATKGMQVLSLDEYYEHVKKAAGGPPAPAGPSPGAPKRFPRKEKPTVKMKPVSDQEAMANLKAGKWHEKSLAKLAAIKALVAGGISHRTDRGRLTMNLHRAMSVMPKPKAVRPPGYLPGVSSPSSPMRKPLGIKKPKMSASPVAAKSMDGWMAIDDASEHVVQKSEGDASMTTKMNYNDLFKSELGTPAEDVLADCPHCEAPITKSDLEKAHQGKGAVTQFSGKKNGSSSAYVVDDNPQGGVMRGGTGKGQVTSSRGVPGAKKTDEPVGVQNSKGSKTHKSDAESDGSEVVEKSLDAAPPVIMMKSSLVGGSEYVQWHNTGEDERIAKSISEGIAAQEPTRPMDLNHDMSRLLT